MPVELLKRFAGSTTIESVAIEFVKEHFLVVHGVVVREPDGRRGGGRRAGLREDVVQEDVGCGRVELQDRVLDRDGRADDGRLVDVDGARVGRRGRRGRGSVERVVDLRGRGVRAAQLQVERRRLVAVRLGEGHRGREVAEALGHVGGAGRGGLHVDERAVAGNEPRAGRNRERAVAVALDLLLRREVDLLDHLLARIGELEEFARGGELEDSEGLVRRVLGRIDVDLVEPDDLVAAGGDHARAEDRRLVLLAGLRVVGEVPAREVDVHRGAVVELDPVHLGDALRGHDATLVLGRVRRHDLVDLDQGGDRDGRRDAVERLVAVHDDGDRRGGGEHVSVGRGEGHDDFRAVVDGIGAFDGLDRDAVRRHRDERHVRGKFGKRERVDGNGFRGRHVCGGQRLVRVHDDGDRRVADEPIAGRRRERRDDGGAVRDRVDALDPFDGNAVSRHGYERHVRGEISDRQCRRLGGIGFRGA